MAFLGAPLRRLLAGAFLCALPGLVGADRAPQGLSHLPPIVFVSRGMPTGADAGQIPGLGPHGSTIIVGGRLLIRGTDGTVRELVPHEKFIDVQDPDVSPDAKRVVFSGVAAGERHWRLWSVNVAGDSLTRLDRDDAGANVDSNTDIDAVDPCWFADAVIYVRVLSHGSLYDGGPWSTLALLGRDGRSETLAPLGPAGALDPEPDPRTGRLLFSRWWFNPWHVNPQGTLERPAPDSHPEDEVNLWQPVSARLLGGPDRSHWLGDLRLEAGGAEPRRASMALQCTRLADGSIVGTAARNTGLAPTPGATYLQRFGRAPSPGSRVTGAAIAEDAKDLYAEGENLAATGACAPAALPDGRILASLDRGGRGDFGLFVIDRDGRAETVLDLEGTSELDAAPVVAHAAGRTSRATLSSAFFRFRDSDVYSGAGAPARTAGAHLRVHELRADGTLRTVEDAPVPRSGHVELRLQAGARLFETLVDSTGRVLMTAHGPAQVRGFNSGAPGTTVTCRGCHLGHSTLR